MTRTVSRAGRHPTGIDRIEHAYIAHLVQADTPLFGILRTKLGYLLLNRNGCSKLLAHCETPLWNDRDLLSRMTRRNNPARAVTETGLRKIALDRSMPARLGGMLARHIPRGSVYLNVGQTNFDDQIIRGVRSIAETQIATYLHDTIPLDWPDTQTLPSREKFRQVFATVDRHADLILCNSEQTRSQVLHHAKHLTIKKTHVLAPGLPEIIPGTRPDGPWTNAPYFLAIGTIEPRKNIGFLLDLWRDFSEPDDPHLVICGRRGWLSEEVFQRLDQHPPNVHECNDLSDPELWGLLANSQGLLFPSIAEGFGYPAIEAAHLNVPVICTPLPVFKSVLNEYAIYAETSERYVWVNKIIQLAQRRRDQSGEQLKLGAFRAPSWQAHFNMLFTLL